ncbi:putative membrane protein [Bacillus pseudomycoides]|nr:putative membrane protein [Bacillus pseudomycoides]
MFNKWMLIFALIGIIVVFSCGMLLPMAIGFKVSMITAGIIMIVMFSIIIPFDKKYIVRKKGNKIDFTKNKSLLSLECI